MASNKFEVEIREIELKSIDIRKDHRVSLGDSMNYFWYEDRDGNVYRKSINDSVYYRMKGKTILRVAYPLFTLDYYAKWDNAWGMKMSGVIEIVNMVNDFGDGKEAL